MIPVIPTYITLLVVGACLSLPFLLGGLVAVGAGRAGLLPDARRRVVLGTIAGSGLWAGALLIASPSLASLATADPTKLTLQIPFFTVAGMGLAFAAFRTLPSFRAALGAIPLPALVAIQFYRVIGGVFLPLYALGILPAHFSVPAGWGDVAVGLLAPIVALSVGAGLGVGRLLAWLWNLMGMTDLVVAVGMGTGVLASLLTGTHVLPAGPMGAYPLILVPAFAVPVSMLLHFLVLRNLARAAAPSALRMGMPA